MDFKKQQSIRAACLQKATNNFPQTTQDSLFGHFVFNLAFNKW
jgi:hypothetical protein